MTRDMLLVAHDHGASDVEAAVLVRPAAASADLRVTIESLVIPRLCQAFQNQLTHKRHALIVDRAAAADPLADQVEGLVDHLLCGDIEDACTRIDIARAQAHSLDRIFLELLMPAAYRISQLMAEDICTSTAGVVAFCNLQIVVRRYAEEFRDELGRPPSGLRALLVSPAVSASDAAGLQVFGLLLTSEFFRREGWEAWTERSVSSASFRDAVRSQWFDLVEVLATDDVDLDHIASGIKIIRRGAPNPSVGIVACGRVFVDHPEYVRLVGADHSEADPLAALMHAGHVVAGGTRRRRLS